MAMDRFEIACNRFDGGTDPDLGDYVTRTKSLDELADPESQHGIAVGLKGVGKTSAYRFLTMFDKTPDIAIAISPDTHSLSLASQDLNWSVCRKQFEHDLVIEALRNVCDHASSIKQKYPKAPLNEAQKHTQSYLDWIKKKAGRVKALGASILGCGFSITKDDAPTLVGLLPDKDIEDARRTLKKICAAGVQIRIVVDDPELVFSAGRELDTDLVGGFCLAALRLSADVAKFKVIGFLKTHVYHPVRVRTEDLSKYPDHMSRLNWSAPELQGLVENRLKWANMKWTDTFDCSGESEAKSLVHSMTERIRNGPRDLLRWLGLAIKNAGKKKIRKQHLDAVHPRMSSDALREMESAHSSSYEKLGALVKAVFRSKTRTEFPRQQFEEHLENLLVNDSRMRALSTMSWMQKESSDTLAQLLFEVGALAFRLNGKVILPYQEEYQQENFDFADKLFLTPALSSAVKSL